QLESTTTALARQLADGPRQALGSIKQNPLDAPHQTLDESLAAEIPPHNASGIPADHLPAVQAFARKEDRVVNPPGSTGPRRGGERQSRTCTTTSPTGAREVRKAFAGCASSANPSETAQTTRRSSGRSRKSRTQSENIAIAACGTVARPSAWAA